ncbi:bifunctional helix-turn-helix transcriptional regulator/GNAT family N-acetyltransferase [Flavimaribacter sediminis]|uniref:bifunctional helix-turn-helix transcriptional regulator/GNAT family N-acetyltransferase n=1 Tax=Flavimaribacter sediminis TaxID=2865987 RepID=UPI00215DAEC7|nr:bifunctional helix-turn-helix transcriptional regulator/GNAT family N-acetyltransferase [Flavimaribacter sediminis]
MRILYEVANAPAGGRVSAADLGRDLVLDAGYLSRLIVGLEKRGLITRLPSRDNAKRLDLELTEKGRATFAKLNAASAAEVTALLGRLHPSEQRQLVGSMHRIERLLGTNGPDRIVTLRDPEPGDFGAIIHRQTRLYATEYGWDWTFEALLGEIVSKFITKFDPARDRCWIAESEGEIIGSVFVTREDDEIAKLRMLYVEESARGMGLGRRLVDECIRFAKARGYSRMVLWTNDILVSARRIYEAAGFTLFEEEPHHSFGKDLVGQMWERDL